MSNIGQHIKNFFTFGVPKDDATPCIMIDGEGYHSVLSERGHEFERRTTYDLTQLMYWIASDVTWEVAQRFAVKNPKKNLEQRRVRFMKQLELMQKINPVFAEKRKQEIIENNLFTDGLPNE